MNRKVIIILTGCFFITTLLTDAQEKSKSAYAGKEAKITDEIDLKDEDIELFKEHTRQKVDEFQQHIVTIGDKSQPAEKRDMAEREALKLFYTGAEMETSTIMPDGSVKITSRPMEKYLSRLKALPYTQVVIEFYDIAYVREFTKGPDGRYYSTATIFQKFTGFDGDNIMYTDITQKEIEIILELVEDKFFNEKRWVILLGNIKATETKESA